MDYHTISVLASFTLTFLGVRWLVKDLLRKFGFLKDSL